MRGYVEVNQNEDGGYTVDDWSEHYDSGSHVGEYPDLLSAILAAQAWSQKHNRKMMVAVS